MRRRSTATSCKNKLYVAVLSRKQLEHSFQRLRTVFGLSVSSFCWYDRQYRMCWRLSLFRCLKFLMYGMQIFSLQRFNVQWCHAFAKFEKGARARKNGEESSFFFDVFLLRLSRLDSNCVMICYYSTSNIYLQTWLIHSLRMFFHTWIHYLLNCLFFKKLFVWLSRLNSFLRGNSGYSKERKNK